MKKAHSPFAFPRAKPRVLLSVLGASLLKLFMLGLFWGLPLFASPCEAGVSMESNGNVMSIDGQGEAPPGGMHLGVPPRTRNGTQGEYGGAGLPWGLVPEVHVPWYPGFPQRPVPLPGYRPGGALPGKPPYDGGFRPPPPRPIRPPKGSGLPNKERAPLPVFGKNAAAASGAGISPPGAIRGSATGLQPGPRSSPPGMPPLREYAQPTAPQPGGRQLYPGMRQPLPGNTPQPVFPGEKPPPQGPRQNRPPL